MLRTEWVCKTALVRCGYGNRNQWTGGPMQIGCSGLAQNWKERTALYSGRLSSPTAMQNRLRSLPFYSAERLISPIEKQKQKPVVQETLS